MSARRKAPPRNSTVQEQKTLKGFYQLGDTIGSGGFGKVKLATHILTGETVAIKIVDKNKLKNDKLDELFRVQREIEILKDLQHPWICKLYHVVDSIDKIYIVLEYCRNGELFDYILDRSRLSEDAARRYFRQIVSAVAYMHKHGCAHRDLKPENLLLDDEGNIKLIDFGLAARPASGMDTFLSTFCGSPTYVAPEIVSGQMYRGGPADIWSLGIILYAIVVGSLPFSDDNTDKLFQKIEKGEYSIPAYLTNECRDLITRMLQTDPAKRITMEHVMSHDWVLGQYRSPVKWDLGENHCHDEKVFDFIRNSPNGDRMLNLVKRGLADQHLSYWAATFFILRKRHRLGKQLRLQASPMLWMDAHETFTFSPSIRPCYIRSSGGIKEPPSPSKRMHSVLSFDESSSSDNEDENASNHGLPDLLLEVSEVGGFKDPNIFLAPKYPSSERENIMVKPASPRITPSRSVETGMADFKTPLLPVAKNKSKSVDDGLDQTCQRTPPKAKKMVKTCEKPGVLKKMFGSVEKFGRGMANRLTPLKSLRTTTHAGRSIRVLTGDRITCNVVPVPEHCKNPDAVFDVLLKAVTECGFSYKIKRNGVVFAKKIKGDGSVLIKLSLEVCWLSDRNVCGYIRKRIQGDAFQYHMCVMTLQNILHFPQCDPSRTNRSPWVVSPQRLDFGPETTV